MWYRLTLANKKVCPELNDRLDSALQQIETVSRQLCSVQQEHLDNSVLILIMIF